MASQQRDIARLDRALSCPIVASALDYPLAARNLLYECWATLLYRYLPDPSVVDLLIDWEQTAGQSIYLMTDECADEASGRDVEPEPCNPAYLESLSADEIDGFSASLEGSRSRLAAQAREAIGPRVREDVGSAKDKAHPAPEPKSLCGVWLDKEFDRLSEWVRRLRVVEGSERDKHWPPPHVRTRDDLIVYSRKKADVGWLHPATNPGELRRFALAALAAHFFRALQSKTGEDVIKNRVFEFLDTWDEVFARGTFRLGITHRVSMGLANGEDCRRVVYDFDPSSMQFHCFPVAAFPPVREAFAEDQLDL